MTKPGDLDRLITIVRAGEQTGTNAFGEPIYGPAVEKTISAGRKDVSDGERFAAGQVGSHIMTRFVVRYSPFTAGISPIDTLQHEGRTYEITGIKETADGRRRFLEITAVADLDATLAVTDGGGEEEGEDG